MSGRGRKRAEAELNQVLALDPVGDALVHGDLGDTNLLWATVESGPRLTGILDWDEARIGNQADDLASIAVTVGWPLAVRVDAQRHGGDTPTIPGAKAIAATFVLRQALPAALSGDAPSLADGLSAYRDPQGHPARSTPCVPDRFSSASACLLIASAIILSRPSPRQVNLPLDWEADASWSAKIIP
jgi:hypothetical protein